MPSYQKIYSHKRGASLLSKVAYFNPDVIEVCCTLAQVPALIRKQPKISCCNHVVTRTIILVPNGKFSLTREIPSIASLKSHMVEEDFDDDSSASVSNEELEFWFQI